MCLFFFLNRYWFCFSGHWGVADFYNRDYFNVNYKLSWGLLGVFRGAFVNGSRRRRRREQPLVRKSTNKYKIVTTTKKKQLEIANKKKNGAIKYRFSSNLSFT